MIASLLRLETSAHEGQPLAHALLESQHRVESMALIHELLHESWDVREVDMARHAELLTHSLFESYGVDPARIGWRVTLGPMTLGVDQAIPAGLILNELISNALKHGFPDGHTGGVVSIEGGAGGGRVVLEVRDNGVGVPGGLERGGPESLGLEIVNVLTRQLKGTLELDRCPGTAFRVSFPEQNGYHTH